MPNRTAIANAPTRIKRDFLLLALRERPASTPVIPRSILTPSPSCTMFELDSVTDFDRPFQVPSGRWFQTQFAARAALFDVHRALPSQTAAYSSINLDRREALLQVLTPHTRMRGSVYYSQFSVYARYPTFSAENAPFADRAHPETRSYNMRRARPLIGTCWTGPPKPTRRDFSHSKRCRRPRRDLAMLDELVARTHDLDNLGRAAPRTPRGEWGLRPSSRPPAETCKVLGAHP